jgi:hypothetical protein
VLFHFQETIGDDAMNQNPTTLTTDADWQAWRDSVERRLDALSGIPDRSLTTVAERPHKVRVEVGKTPVPVPNSIAQGGRNPVTLSLLGSKDNTGVVCVGPDCRVTIHTGTPLANVKPGKATPWTAAVRPNRDGTTVWLVADKEKQLVEVTVD